MPGARVVSGCPHALQVAYNHRSHQQQRRFLTFPSWGSTLCLWLALVFSLSWQRDRKSVV